MDTVKVDSRRPSRTVIRAGSNAVLAFPVLTDFDELVALLHDDGRALPVEVLCAKYLHKCGLQRSASENVRTNAHSLYRSFYHLIRCVPAMLPGLSSVLGDKETVDAALPGIGAVCKFFTGVGIADSASIVLHTGGIMKTKQTACKVIEILLLHRQCPHIGDLRLHSVDSFGCHLRFITETSEGACKRRISRIHRSV